MTGVLADRNPVELHFFRNYDPPASERDRAPCNFELPPRPNGKCGSFIAHSTFILSCLFKSCA